MVFGHKNNGLDLSGVGRSSRKITGGRAKNKSGFVMAPHSSMRKSTGNSGVMGKGSFRGAMTGRRDRRIPPRTLAMAIALAVFAIGLSVLVGYLVYQHTVRNAVKPELDDAALSAVLVEASEDSTSNWVVAVATDAQTAAEGRGNVVDLALMYADSDNKSLSVLWIPLDTRVYIDGYGYYQIGEAFDIDHEVTMVTAVSKLAGVDIAHYLEVNRYGLSRLEELLGIGGKDMPSDDAASVVNALARRLFGASNEQLATRAGHVLTCVATDMDEQGAEEEFAGLQGMDTDSELYMEQMPYQEVDEGDEKHVVPVVGEWTTMVTRVASGMSPVASTRELGDYEQIRNSNVVDIWNGVGVTGVAGDCAEELRKHGWTVESTTNAAQFVYEETLVVYKDNADEEAAKLLIADLGQGRVVRSAYRYSFTGDVLVVVGKDYQPH